MGASLTDDANLSGPSPTAIGGTQDVALEYDPGTGIFRALDLAFLADDDGGNGIAVDHVAGSVVSVRGIGSRTNYLRILDADTNELFDRKELSGAAVDTISVVPGTPELVPAGMDVAYAAGDVHIGVALYGSVQEGSGPTTERLVDQSMQLALTGSTQRAWDELEMPSAVAGTHALGVTAGNRPTANIDVIVVDHLDSLVADSTNDTTLLPNASTELCFDGMAGGRYVAGLAWQFSVGQHQSAGYGNCVTVTAPQTGTVSVIATASGLSATATVTVGTARMAPRRKSIRSTAGERAAM